MLISDLYESMNELRHTPAYNLVEPAVVTEDSDSISKIIGILAEGNSYEVFAPLSEKVMVINVRDILGARNIGQTNPSKIGKIIPTLNSENTISDAARIMSLYRMRALPFFEQNEIIGQITAKKIVEAIRDVILASSKQKTNASDIMTPNPIVVSESDKVTLAQSIMKRRRIDHLPVLKDSRLLGMISSKDIMELMLQPESVGRKSLGIDNTQDRLDIAIGGILDKNVLTAEINDSLLSAVDLIVSQNSTYCIIKATDEVQGIITYRDIINLLGEKVEEEIPIFIIGLPDDPLDSELAKSKFTNLVRLLKKAYPNLEEARCRIKIRQVQGARKRYEVDARIITTQSVASYVTVGWDLPKMFDQMSDSLKKRLAHRVSQKQRRLRYTGRPLS
ncbi:MAG TPA: CBS domain-containing protein [Nitrososphaeraceae archaeon]|jgi:CBS domain-containing protein|nr:CBS domain-containing protein [Nitrososphaeraceae archaeon]